MNIKRRNAGVTLAEMLIVVAIIAVLSGVAFIGVQSYLRGMTQLEYDVAAKEIFVVAQNHLALAHSQGYPGMDEDDAFGEKDPSYEDTDKMHDAVRYFVVTNGDLVGDSSKLLSQMLPELSIDASLLYANYIIAYNKETGNVLDVFYSGGTDHSGFGRTDKFAHAFTDAEYETLVGDRDDPAVPGLRGDAQKSARKNYTAAKHVIGWYGTNDQLADYNELEITPPLLELVNGPRLFARLTVPAETLPKISSDGLKFLITVTGRTSGEKKTFSAELVDGSFTQILDDVTEDGQHFLDICGDAGLIPGEDIEVEAFCYSHTKLAATVSSGKRTGNSLFGPDTSVHPADGAASAYVEMATVANFRHLENMSPAVSGISDNTLDLSPYLEAAKQINDLDWKESWYESDIPDPLNPDTLQIFPADGSDASEEGTYLPVDTELPIEYDGQGYSIKNVTIDAAGSAGLFGTLESGSEVHDLELVNFSVTGADAGALAGASAADIRNVLVRHERNDGDAAKAITGSGSAGGLVGSMTGGTVEYSAAAVYVSSSATETTSGAGGLVGSMTGGSVSYSYSGGHTANGAYSDTDLNVVSPASAGGLVGYMGGGTAVENSYSTCSVQGNTAGGLVGTSAGAISDSYCTGLVLGAGTDPTVFAFVGSGSVGDENSYYSIINDNYYQSKGEEKLPACGDDTVTVAAIDESAASFNDFYRASAGAQPYDALLTVHYDGKYLFRAISEFPGNDAGSGAFTRHLTAHYGDWPEAETLVTNVSA